MGADVEEGRIFSRMYCVKTGRMELLFWKKEPAGLTNWKSEMYSVDLALGSVIHVLRWMCSPLSSITASESVSFVTSYSFLGIRFVSSRSRSVAPLW